MRQKVDTWKIPAVFGSIFSAGAIAGALLAVKWCYNHLPLLDVVYNLHQER